MDKKQGIALLVIIGFAALILGQQYIVEKEGAGMDDPYIWLEEVEGERALAWVEEQNTVSVARLQGDARYEAYRESASEYLNASDRIAYGSVKGDMVYNFWQDENNVRGLWRRTSLLNYHFPKPDWETVLDLDALAEAEGENWVYKGYDCAPGGSKRCMLRLSRGGGDAVVMREFDLETKSFVDDGFMIPEGKTTVEWLDEDTLVFATAAEGYPATNSGYAATLRKWSRGQDISEAKVLKTVDENVMGLWPIQYARPEGTTTLVRDTYTGHYIGNFWYLGDDDSLTPVALPYMMEIQTVFEGQLVTVLGEDWTVEGDQYKTGDLMSIDLAATIAAGEPRGGQLIYSAGAKGAVTSANDTSKHLYIFSLEDVVGKVRAATLVDGKWVLEESGLPQDGTLSVVSADRMSSNILVNYETFTTPDSLWHAQAPDTYMQMATLPPKFAADDLVTEQRWATSKDGTRVPYFIIYKEGTEFNGNNPTLQYAYGGFLISMQPRYLGPPMTDWLEAGGIYVVANIRGGGEYGPAWHKAALLEKRQNAYDDMISVSEHLIETGVTNPSKLGIRGGSNGGLLMGAMFTQRPDLYKAVITAVPLLDMLRYHKLLAGASWMPEYGNPDIPEERAFISKYSPYQNVHADRDYPEIFFYTSTRDDRVHPGHARKMVAKMMDQGHQVIYYENTEGGHAAAANLNQRAHMSALQLVYLMQKLMDE